MAVLMWQRIRQRTAMALGVNEMCDNDICVTILLLLVLTHY